MPVLAKVAASDLYIDLKGFVSHVTVDCPQCDCTYRVFYEAARNPQSVKEAALNALAFDEAIEKSHPGHPARIRL